jgi:hypothetical protein
MAHGGSIEGLKVGSKVGFLRPRIGRYEWAEVLSIDGDNVNLVVRHPKRKQWDNYFTETKQRIEKYTNTVDENWHDGRGRTTMKIKYEHGGSMYAKGGSTNIFSPIREGNNVAYLGEGYKIIKIDNKNNVVYIKPLKDALDRQTTDFNINSNGVSKVDLSTFKKYAFDIKDAISMAHGGSMYADGGNLGKTGIKTYKLRAEGLNDFLAFLQNDMYFKIKSFTIEPTGFPDVVVTFDTSSSLTEIKQKLKEVPDSHVMLQTVKPFNEYTGEREEEGEYANGGSMSKSYEIGDIISFNSVMGGTKTGAVVSKLGEDGFRIKTEDGFATVKKSAIV